MLDRLPTRAGWSLLVVGALLVSGSCYGILRVAPLGALGATLAAVLYVGSVGVLAHRHSLSRRFLIITRLLFPAAVFVLLLESAAQGIPGARLVLGSVAVLVAGIYLAQLGILKLRGISTSYDR
jgi:hypothetical protein